MRILDRLLGATNLRPAASRFSAPEGVLITDAAGLDEAIRNGSLSAAGMAVTPDQAMRIGAVFACVRLLCSPVATLPFDIKRRVDARTREDASDHYAWSLMRRRPNRWQKPHQFKRMMQAHVLLRGNAYAYKVPGVGGRIQGLIPLHPDRVEEEQLADLSLVYKYRRPQDGAIVRYTQDQIFHLYSLTLDGIRGVSPLAYARETIGTSLAMERHVGRVMAKGARASGILRTDKSLTDKAFTHLKESLEEFRQHGEKEGEVMLLEEGLDYKSISLSPADLQWIEARKLTRSDIAMYFGVPPSMIGDNSGSDSNWGTGLEQKTNWLTAYALEDHFTMWEEGVTVDLLGEDEKLYARFNRAALARADLKTRWGAYVSALQWGVSSPNEIRALEDENPREGGDIYYDPPNTAGGADPFGGDPNDPSQKDPTK